MTCPKCQTRHAEPILSWTVSGRKLTIPVLHLWGCVNRDCRHRWPRELSSPIHEVAQDGSLRPTPKTAEPPIATATKDMVCPPP